MGKTWTTEPQRVWLQARLEDYLSSRRTRTVSRFLTAVTENWFQEWPERLAMFPDIPVVEPLSAEQQNAVNAGVGKRKEQIRNWYSWIGNVRRRSTASASMKAVEEMLDNDTQDKRILQPIEMYQRLYQHKVGVAVKEAFASESARLNRKLSPSERMTIQRATVSGMFGNESIEVKLEVDGEIEKAKQAKLEAKNRVKMDVEDGDELGVDGRTPEEYHRSILNVNSILNPVLESVAAKTGWTLFVLAGGPNPAENGAIYLNSYHAGDRSKEGGKEFDQAYLGFKEHIETPFARYLSACYPPDVRAKRVMGLPSASIRRADLDNEINYLGRPPLTNTPSTLSQPALNTAALDSDGTGSAGTAPALHTPQVISTPSPRKDLLTRYRTGGEAMEGAAPSLSSRSSAGNGSMDMVGCHPGDADAGGDSDEESEFGDRMDLVPGGPSSPISHAFARMNPPPVLEKDIDPTLLVESSISASFPLVSPPQAVGAVPRPLPPNLPPPPTTKTLPSHVAVGGLPPVLYTGPPPLVAQQLHQSLATTRPAFTPPTNPPNNPFTDISNAITTRPLNDFTVPNQPTRLVKKLAANQDASSSEPIIRRSGRSKAAKKTGTSDTCPGNPQTSKSGRKSNKGTWEIVLAPVSPPEKRLPM